MCDSYLETISILMFVAPCLYIFGISFLYSNFLYKVKLFDPDLFNSIAKGKSSTAEDPPDMNIELNVDYCVSLHRHIMSGSLARAGIAAPRGYKYYVILFKLSLVSIATSFFLAFAAAACD